MQSGTGPAGWRWRIVALGAALWLLASLGLIAESRADDALLHPGCLVVALVVDGLLSLATRQAQTGAIRGILLLKTGVAFAVAAVIGAAPEYADMVAGFLVGGFFIVDSAQRAVAAASGRCVGWRQAIGLAALEVLLGLWVLLSYTLQGQGKASFDVGVLLTHSTFSLCVIAWRLRRVLDRPAQIA